LAEASLPAAKVTHPDFYRFEFPAQVDSTNHDYYVRMSLSGEGQVEIGAGPGKAYLDGALYQNDIPQDNQLAFRLVYDPYQVFIGLGLMMVSWLGIIAIAGFLYILPGWAVLGWLEPDWEKRSWGEKLGLSAGVSLAIYPILFLWTYLVGLNLGPMYAWFPPILGLGLIVWRNRRWRPGSGTRGKLALRLGGLHAIGPADMLYLFILVLIIATRFWVIRNLSIPLWGDSYQHTMIAQLLVDNNGLFNSWEPYADLQTFTYHFGFHTLVAVFHWISNFPMPSATLWTGQILSRWAGVGAVFLAGLLFQMPMYYVNWGRYTQLAGQVILPIAILVLWTILESDQIDWKLIGLSWVTIAGLALTHYRVLIFSLLFLVAYPIAFPVTIKNRFLNYIKKYFWIGCGAGLLFLPWLVHVFAGQIPDTFFDQITTPASNLSAFSQQYNSVGDLSIYLPDIVWLLAPIVFGWGTWRRDKGFALIALWWFLIYLAANPEQLNMPGAGAISNFAVFIAAYLPISILFGTSLSWIVEFGHDRLRIWRSGNGRGEKSLVLIAASFLALGLFVLGLWGAREQTRELNVIQHALVARPDIRAANWIRESIPQEARFLVNSFFAYGNSLAVGSDAGWWLPLLAERATTLPPINYGSETGPIPQYREWINELIIEIQAEGINSQKVLKALSARKITYLYVGQRQGSVNYSGPDLINPELALRSSHFIPVYHQDKVWIFKVIQ
jgi:hypothetical protein